MPKGHSNAVDTHKRSSAQKTNTSDPPPVFPPNHTKKTSEEPNTGKDKREGETPDRLSPSEKIALAASLFALFQFGIMVATWWTMVRTARRQLRAYVHFDEGNVIDFDTDCPIVQVKVRNFGQTPAYAVVSMNMIHSAAFPLTKPLPALDPEIRQPRGVLSPGAHFILLRRLDEPRPLPSERKAAIKEGTAALCVYGEIAYRDAFGKQHTTTYRCIYGGGAGIHPGGNLATCEDGNDAD